MGKIGGGFLSGLGAVGSALDLPGSMVRDVFTGNNPFDQWLTPFNLENRATGRDVLGQFGMRPNVESGIKGWLDDPGEGLRDISGFGAELLLDPLTYLTFGGASLSRAGQATKRAGLLPVVDRLRKGGIQAGNLTDNAKRLTEKAGFLGPRRARQELTVEDILQASDDPLARQNLDTAATAMGTSVDDLMGQPLGHHFGLAAPFADPFVTFNAGAVGRGMSSAFDKIGNVVKNIAPVRYARGLLDPRASGQYDRVGQEIGELAYDNKQATRAVARETSIEKGDEFTELQKAFDEELGDAIRTAPDDFHPHDLDAAIQEVLPGMREEWEAGRPLREFRAAHPWMTNFARRTDSDYTSIPGYDEMFDQWFSPLGTHTGVTADDIRTGGIYPGAYNSWDDLWEALRGSGSPYPRSTSDFVQEQARRNLEANPPGELPFRHQEVVRAGDRGNYGYVVQPGRERSTVFFRNPQTGAVRTMDLPNDQLTRAFDDPDQAAKASEEYGEGFTRTVTSDLLRATTELGSAERAFRELHPNLTPTPEMLAKFDQTATTWKTQRDSLKSEVESLGGNVRTLEESLWADDSFGAQHFPRYVDKKLAKEAGLTKGRLLPTRADSMKARTLETKNLPAHVRDKILTNSAYRGDNAAQNILRDFGDYLDDRWGRDPEAFDFGDFGDELAETADEGSAQVGREAHAQALADWAVGKPRLGLTGDAFKDHARYIEQMTAAKNSLSAVHEVFYRYAQQGGEIPLAQAMRKAGMKLRGPNGDVNIPDAIDSFARQFGLSAEQARQLKVPQEMVDGATRIVEHFNRGPIWQGKIADAIDGFTQWFKTYVTVPFPGFLSRNLISGQHLNAATALKSPSDLKTYFGEMIPEATKIMHRMQKGLSSGEGLTAADKQLAKELYMYGVIDPQHLSEGVEAVARGGPLESLVPPQISAFRQHKQAANEFVAENPMQFDLLDTTAKKGFDQMGRPQAPSLDSIPGVKSIRRAGRTAVEVGSTANKQVEWMNRVPLYLYFKKRGYSPAQAAKEVIARHFDYGDVTDFSRSVMKRVFPFWTFTSKIAPLVGKELIERPGGGIGQTIRATNIAAGGQEEPLPQHVRETSSIPLGEADDGTLRFLTGLGLAHESPLAFLGQSPLRTGLMEGLSQSNPLIKAPLEWATGESFFQRGPTGGRDIEAMDPLLGRIGTNLGLLEEDPLSGRAPSVGGPLTEQVVANSPFSRMLSTVRQLTDERKRQNPTVFPGDALALNLLTGLKTTDVSPASQDAVVRDMVAPIVMDELGGRTYENRYIPKQTIEETRKRGDLETAERMEAFNRLNRMLAKRAKERKKEKTLQ